MKSICMGWGKLDIFVWLLSLSLSLSCTTQKLSPRCEANQAGGEDQLVGVGRCQRDRLDQGAGGDRDGGHDDRGINPIIVMTMRWSGQRSGGLSRLGNSWTTAAH